MYLHLGDGRRVAAADVVAIYDAGMFRGKRASCPDNCRALLSAMRADEEPAELSDSHIQSVIVTDSKVYFSAISSVTLGRRLANPLARTNVLLDVRNGRESITT